jgi:hypothetical protein
MPRNATTGVFTRVSNSFSSPVFGTLIDPSDAEAYFDDLDVGLNPPELDGPLRLINSLQVGTTGSAAGTIDFLNATSGTITLAPPAGALGTRTLTLPAATDTLIGKDTTDTLTNKTLTSPVLTTPNLGTPSVLVGTNITGTAAGLTAGTFTAGSATNLTSGTLPAARTNGHMNGTATNDAAAAGEIGELIEATLASGSATSLTTATAKDIITASLTAGDWDVSCVVYFVPTATTSMTNWTASVSATANTLDITPGRWGQWAGAAQVDVSTAPKSQSVNPYRISLSGTTTLRCVAQATFTASTLTAYGYIRARRVR